MTFGVPLGIHRIAPLVGTCYTQRMNRTVTRIARLTDQTVLDDFVPGSAADRLSLVWPLTEQATSLSRRHNAERRLQRDVTVLGLRKR